MTDTMTPQEIVSIAMYALAKDTRPRDEKALAFLDILSRAGFVVVPREPTDKMQEYGWAEMDMKTATPSRVYKAMLSANEEKK